MPICPATGSFLTFVLSTFPLPSDTQNVLPCNWKNPSSYGYWTNPLWELKPSFHLFPGQTQIKPASINFIGNSISSIHTTLLAVGYIHNLTAGQQGWLSAPQNLRATAAFASAQSGDRILQTWKQAGEHLVPSILCIATKSVIFVINRNTGQLLQVCNLSKNFVSGSLPSVLLVLRSRSLGTMTLFFPQNISASNTKYYYIHVVSELSQELN